MKTKIIVDFHFCISVPLKLISLISGFVMNYPNNGEHQDLSNLSPRNLFLKVYSDIIFLFQICYFIIQYLGYPSMNLSRITSDFRQYTKA